MNIRSSRQHCFNSVVLGFALFLAGPCPLEAGDRVALVIGNNDYPEDSKFPDLKNCVNDAALLKSTLEATGFEVIHLENATRSEMDDGLAQFESAIQKGGTAVCYFAGHGIEFEGKNYLMGSNTRLYARSRLGEEGMDAETFASAMILAGAGSSFMFLDCCRDSPDDAAWLTRGLKKKGLTDIRIDGDIIISFAASPGQTALDGIDGNGPYARALARWMKSGLKHGDMFDRIRLEVHESTSGLQRTWESGSFLKPFVFNTSALTSDSSPVSVASSSSVTPPWASPNPQRFLYRDQINPGMGEYRYTNGSWLETCPDGTVFRFREIARSATSLDLFDESRQMGIRLSTDRSQWNHAVDSGGQWVDLYLGRWDP